MKAKTYSIVTLSDIQKAVSAVAGILPDGKTEVVIKNAGSKSSKQRGLDWIWNDDICKALIGTGSGHFDSKDDVHDYCKWYFAIPIFQRDDDFFSDLFDLFKSKYGSDQNKMRIFVRDHVSTERFSTSQMAEYLTEKQNHFTSQGVELTDPSFAHLLD
jgi:hypothetical protein